LTHSSTTQDLIFSRHLKRVVRYARPSDYAMAGGMAAVSPVAFWMMERVSPSHVGKGGFAPVMRLATAIGLIGGLHVFYQRSTSACDLVKLWGVLRLTHV
jgi:hypothetical protein